jgi:triosephosphate isomerase
MRYNKLYLKPLLRDAISIHFIIMKKLFIVANWKSHITNQEASHWLTDFKDTPISNTVEAIVCPSFTLLSPMSDFIKTHSLPIKLGTQNISPFPTGAYTGEVNAQQAAEFVTHAIVGHSERRRYFGETDEQVVKKIERLLEVAITPILCVSDMKQMDYYLSNGTIIQDHADKIIFVYEPPNAISGDGAYHADSPENAGINAGEISSKIGRRVITLYGGSMNPQNCQAFFAQENIDGGLIGQASLDAKTFQQLIPSI